MSSGFRALPNADLTRAVEELLLPRLADALREKVAGHCMRVTDLEEEPGYAVNLVLVPFSGVAIFRSTSQVCS